MNIISRICAGAWLLFVSTGFGAGTALIGWNNLGMHCTDGSDFSVFSILPHYNTIQAQLVINGKLVKNPTGYTVTYEAIADPSGSINRTSQNKGNFYQFVQTLYGAALTPDAGLAGSGMPGSKNTPQPMKFDPKFNWFIAEGIPITPYDDAGHKNFYPMMRLVARDSAKRIITTTDIVLPVSDEMSCISCHGSGKNAAAKPQAGWVNNSDPTRDYKLNILRLHDEREAGLPEYAAALKQAGYSSGGLYANVINNQQPVLCARCHASEALPGTGIKTLPPLTQAIHAFHAGVQDPATGLRLEDQANRSSCYKCHPGAETKCLRGAMGNAVAANGTMAMQCQNCHGTMSQVGRPNRTGWLQEPNCQSCHSGTATSNGGQIRFTSVFDAAGKERVPANTTFATSPDTPLAGTSLFRFSRGHGGLQCEACHGSTHAEYPSSHVNDNLQSRKLQGHIGVIAECTTCHNSTPSTINGGPHGMHPLGTAWVQRHGDAAENNTAQCKSCHGADLRGTVLSRTFGDRALITEDFGTKNFWKGSQIGCYACHNGPNSESQNRNRAPSVSSATIKTAPGKPISMSLQATDLDQNPLTLRIVSQPAHGTTGLAGTQATYYPEAGFIGTDQFTFAAWDGSIDSNLGQISITVAQLGVQSSIPANPLIPFFLTHANGMMVISWPATVPDVTVKHSSQILPGASWLPVTGTPALIDGYYQLEIPENGEQQFFKLESSLLE